MMRLRTGGPSHLFLYRPTLTTSTATSVGALGLAGTMELIQELVNVFTALGNVKSRETLHIQ